MKKTFYAAFFITVIIAIINFILISCNLGTNSTNLTSITFNDISLQFPSQWISVSESNDLVYLYGENKAEGAVISRIQYPQGIDANRIDYYLSQSEKVLQSYNYYFNSKSEILQSELGKELNLEFSYSDDNYTTYSALAKIFVCKSSVYTIQYFEKGIEIKSEDLYRDIIESINTNINNNIAAATTEATEDTETTTTARNIISDKEIIVYIGKTGTKYHNEDCPSLKGKGIEISLEDAKAQGRAACKICKP